MSAEWIKFEKATSDKPEVWAMADNLQIDPDAVVGKLLRVWSWFDDQSEKGNAPIVTKKLLDRIVGVSGFCDSMVLAGWMLECEGEENPGNVELMLPNFDRHNGKTAKNRALTARRVANHKAKTNAEGNADANANGNAPIVNSALPRKEKKRSIYTSEHHKVAEWMFELISKVAPKTKKPDLEVWANEIRKLNEIDQIPILEIQSVFRWANGDKFWSTNILSPSKLREKFGRLDAEARKKSTGSEMPKDYEVGGHYVQ